MQAIRILCAVLTFEGSLEIVYVKLGPVIVTPGVGSVGDLDVLVLEQWLVCALDVLVGQGTDGSLSLLAAGVLDSHGQQEQHRPNCQTFPKLHLVLQDVCCTTHQNWCYFFLWSSPMAVVHARSMGEHGKLFFKKLFEEHRRLSQTTNKCSVLRIVCFRHHTTVTWSPQQPIGPAKLCSHVSIKVFCSAVLLFEGHLLSVTPQGRRPFTVYLLFNPKACWCKHYTISLFAKKLCQKSESRSFKKLLSIK